MKQLLTIATSFLALVIVAGCDNARSPSTTTKHTVSSDGKRDTIETKVDPGKPGTDAETKARKEEKKKEIKAKIDGINANLKVLEDHAGKQTGDAKKKIDDEIKDLSNNRDDLQKKYDKIDTTEASAWDNFVTELNKAADGVNDSAKKSADRIRK